MTLWDQPWVKLNEKVGGLKFTHNIFFEAANLFLPLSHPSRPCSIFDYAFEFFTPVASAIAKMESCNYKIMLEWIVGEPYSVAFDICHNGKGARNEKKLPCTFDRIHLSSIPYVFLFYYYYLLMLLIRENNGGNLSVSAFIMPMLKPLAHSSVTFSINNPFFDTFEEWIKSYACFSFVVCLVLTFITAILY